MNLKSTPHFDKRLAKRIKSKRQLKEKIAIKLKLLIIDLNHPSLKVHKLEGKRSEEYSFSVEYNLRITFLVSGDCILLTDVITHDEY